MQKSELKDKCDWLRAIVLFALILPVSSFTPTTSVWAQQAERKNSVVTIFNRFKKDIQGARGIQRTQRPDNTQAKPAALASRSNKPIPLPRSRPQLAAAISVQPNRPSVIDRLSRLAFQPVRPARPQAGLQPDAALAPVPRRAQPKQRQAAATLQMPKLKVPKNRTRSGAPLILAKVSPSVLRSSCPKRQLVGLTGLRAPREVKLSPQANVQRKVGLATANWMQQVVQPAAKKHFGSEVVKLRVAASFACRTRNGVKGAKLSEHGYGNAIDISIFTLANGKQVSVAKGWKGRRSERLFLRAVNDGACGHFTTVLGPRADRYHQDHFHFDLARHGKSGTHKVCK